MVRLIPFFVLSEHCIQDGKQLTHTGYQRYFFGLSGGKQAHIKRFITGLKRVATRAAMYSADLTPALPPKKVRRPHIVPESRLTGATPISALISRRESVPSSGISANSAETVMVPTPLILLRRSAISLKWLRMLLFMSFSSLASSSSSALR